jgi:hypothetical protein
MDEELLVRILTEKVPVFDPAWSAEQRRAWYDLLRELMSILEARPVLPSA